MKKILLPFFVILFFAATLSVAHAADVKIDSINEIEDTTTNGPTLSDEDSMGTSVADIGDLDDDGVEDVVVGASVYDGSSENTGRAFIMFLNNDGSVKNSVAIDESVTNGPTLGYRYYYGQAVTGLGDLDGDGVEDVAVSAMRSDVAEGGGEVFIHFMNTDGSIKSTTSINGNTTNGPTLNDGDMYGWSVANIGDLDDDGVTDIASGAFWDDGSGSSRGAVHISLLNSDGSVKATYELNDATTNGATINNSDHYGSSLIPLGDLDGDGVEDIGVGAEGDENEPVYDNDVNEGAMHIHFMNTDGSIKSSVELNETTQNFPPNYDNDNYYVKYGQSADLLGDINGDGVQDIVVGLNAYGEIVNSSRSREGGFIIHLLDTNGSVKDSFFFNEATSTKITIDGDINGSDGADAYADSIAGIGDLDGNGIPDLLVGVPGANGGGIDRGRVDVTFLSTFEQGLYQDTDVDGTVDNIQLRFGETITSCNFESGDWGFVDRGGLDELYIDSIDGVSCTGTDNIVNLSVTAKYKFRTGTANSYNLPVITYTDQGTSGSLQASSGPLTNWDYLEIEDGAGPVVRLVFPFDGSSGISTSTYTDGWGSGGKATIYFSESMDQSLVESAISLTDSSNNVVTTSSNNWYSMSDTDYSNDAIGLVPDQELLHSETYTIEVAATADSAEGPNDPAFNGGSAFSSQFTTAAEGAEQVLVSEGTVTIDENTTNGPPIAGYGNYGESASNIGDLDDDGVEDVIVGAPWSDQINTNEGEAFIHFLNADGSIKETVTLNSTTTNMPTLGSGSVYGHGVAGLGDVDDDGVEDIAVSAEGLEKVFVHFMNTDGTIRTTATIDDSLANVPSINGDYGYSLEGVGDLNNDGVEDLAVGAITEDAHGAVFIHFLDASGGVTSTVEINDETTNGPKLASVISDEDDEYGSGIALLEDMNGDGVREIAVGAQGSTNETTLYDYSGAVHIHYMNSDGSIQKTVELNVNTGNGATSQDYCWSCYYGSDVVSLGDLDGDGVGDIAVGEKGREDAEDNQTGVVWVHFMNTDGSIKYSKQISGLIENGPDFADQTYHYYGAGLANLGDLNGSGYNDILVGSPSWDSDTSYRIGRADITFLTDELADSSGSSSSGPTTMPGTVNVTPIQCSTTLQDGEMFSLEESILIEWGCRGSGVDNLNIYHKTPASDSRTLIVTGTPNDGSFEWTPPEELSGEVELLFEFREPGGGVLDEGNVTVVIGEDSAGEEGGSEEDTTTDGEQEEQPEGEDSTGEEPGDESSEETSTGDVENVTLPAGLERGDLFKIANDFNPETRFDTTVYYIDQDGVRHAFPHEKIFMTWYKDYEEVTIIDENILYQIPQGNDILSRPGTKFVKIPSSPDVYYVAPGNILRHIADEELAHRMIGEGWQSNVIDIQPIVLRQYSFGIPITHEMLDNGWVNNMLVATEDSDMWYIGDEERRRVTNNGFEANRFHQAFMFSTTEEVWKDLPTGPAITEQEDDLSLPDIAIAVDATSVEATVQR